MAGSKEKDHSQAADRALHEAIARAAHNRFWYDLSLQLRFQVNQGLGTEPISADLRRRGEEQHPSLAAAVIEGHVERAGALAAQHFALNTEAIRQLLEPVTRETAAPGAAGAKLGKKGA